MADAVLFDLDETLLDRATSLRSFLQDQFSRFGGDLGSVDYSTWERRFVELDARGSVHKSVVYPALLHEYGGRPSAAAHLLADYDAGCRQHARPFSGMADVLGALRRAGKRLGIVTNGESAFQRRHIDALGLSALVDEVLVSEEEGLRKPDPRLFARAAERLGVSPGQCLFVGDNPSADVLGAAAAGMKTAWFRCGQEWPEHLPSNPGPSIESLAEVIVLAAAPTP
ncbi:MAG: HAD family hydrolase [Phenylobacterium sp.]|uniref:HAD family hydrolase n=1 Tax=Phenylobacterium sp. TaxID=1871053 RepID=UPI0025FB27F5|nr:HAD family hydrolase [Phenylobacterium sp.]MBA4012345.1 HAD family hydrolase [Phenylobacterium sp.]